MMAVGGDGDRLTHHGERPRWDDKIHCCGSGWHGAHGKPMAVSGLHVKCGTIGDDVNAAEHLL